MSSTRGRRRRSRCRPRPWRKRPREALYRLRARARGRRRLIWWFFFGERKRESELFGFSSFFALDLSTTSLEEKNTSFPLTSFQQPFQQPRRLPPPPPVPQDAPHQPRVQARHVGPQVHDDARLSQARVGTEQGGVGVTNRVEHQSHLPLEDPGAEARGGEPARVAGDVAEDMEGMAGRAAAVAFVLVALVASLDLLLPSFLLIVSFEPPLGQHLVPYHPDIPPFELCRVVVGAYRQGQSARDVVVRERIAAREREEGSSGRRRRRRRRGRVRGRFRRSVPCSTAAAAAFLLFDSGQPRHGELGRVERRRAEELRRWGLRRRRV